MYNTLMSASWLYARNYIGIAVLLYYTLSSTRSAGLFATNKAKPSIAQRSTVRRKYWQMHADILPDFDLAIQPRFTAENVNKSLPPFLYSSLIKMIHENIFFKLPNPVRTLDTFIAVPKEILTLGMCIRDRI